jgi:hypothetical protein
LNPSWLIFVNEVLDKIQNRTISYKEGCEQIKSHPDVPLEVKIKYGQKVVGRPPKDRRPN